MECTRMARPKRSSKRLDKPRDSRPLRELKEDLGFDEPEWEEFLRHALDGFTDYENAYDPEPDEPLRLSEVPEEWFEGLDPLACVTLRVLKDARPEIAEAVAYYFVQVGLPEPGELSAPPGLGACWLFLARQGIESPVETRRLAHVALHVPQDFFRGLDDTDVVPQCRLILDALQPIDAWDLHALLAAVDLSRLHERAIYHVFKDMMGSAEIPSEVKRELCRGILECPDAVERMAQRGKAVRAALGTDEGWASTPLSYAGIDRVASHHIPGGLKRHAVVSLVRHAGEPLRDVLGAYFMKPDRNQLDAIAMTEGAVDLIREYAEELDDDSVRRLLSRASKDGLAPMRLAAYRAGAERFGRDYARPALKDPARLFRDWAGKYLSAEKPNRRTRSKAQPDEGA
jgi:hypothetical protein